jgi:hypothetical protein
LVGGVDEISAKFTSFRKLDGQLKAVSIKNPDLLKEDSPGTITSEGAHFFLLSKGKGQNTAARFQRVSIKTTFNQKKLTRKLKLS